MGSTERKGRERQEMQQSILDTAMNLFLQEGYENVSIRKIAEKIEYSPATIYLYFADKDEILLALCNMAFEKFYIQLATVAGTKDPVKRLRKSAEAYIAFALEHQEYYDLMFIMRAPMRKLKEQEEPGMGLMSYELLRTNVRDCVDAGALVKETNVDAATFALWSFVHGIAALVIRKRAEMVSSKQLRVLVKGSIDFIMRGMES